MKGKVYNAFKISIDFLYSSYFLSCFWLLFSNKRMRLRYITTRKPNKAQYFFQKANAYLRAFCPSGTNHIHINLEADYSRTVYKKH